MLYLETIGLLGNLLTSLDGNKWIFGVKSRTFNYVHVFSSVRAVVLSLSTHCGQHVGRGRESEKWCPLVS